MMRILLSVILTLTALSGFSQKQSRQRNTIYVLDCTGSMGGYNGAPNIWEPTKKFLKSELEKEARENPDARVVILPFQEKVLHPINVDLDHIAWPNLENVLDNYLKRLTATNICDSWLEAEKHIDQTCDNYIVLMTDGHDNIGGSSNEAQRIKKLTEIFSTFCGKYQNTKGFYVELTQAASLPLNIQNIIDLCDDLYKVDASSGIPLFGCFSDNIININTRDLPVDINLGFSNSGTFATSLINTENPFVDISVKEGSINQGKAILHVESKFGKNIETLNRAISTSTTSIPITVMSEEVNITNPNIDIVINTTPIRSLQLDTFINHNKSEENIRAVKRVKPFLWLEGNSSDTIHFNLNPKFNSTAIGDSSFTLFQLKSDRDISGLEIFYDGESLSTDSTIIIRPDGHGIIDVIIPRQEEDGEFKLYLTEIKSHNLDRINDNYPNNFSFDICGGYSTSISVVEIVFWTVLSLAILFLILWFSIIRNKIYPKFKKGTITIASPYFALIRLSGYRQVVFCSTAKKQGWFDKIWKGKILYHINPQWTSLATVTPSGRNMRFHCPSNNLISDPSPIWTRGSEYSVLNPQSPTTKIKISIQ
ncbi:MAG: VWA domain-containing protein [Muribaculum sp.]|nr:VWA domain-containing protein [Muribaculum sp.]